MVLFYFTITSAKLDQIPYFFTVKFTNDLRKKLELELAPPLKSVAVLSWEKQVVNYTLYSTVQSDEKRLTTVNVHEECYFFIFLHRLISVMCLKCPPLAHMHILSHECHWSMDASIVHCSMLCQTFFFITERNE